MGSAIVMFGTATQANHPTDDDVRFGIMAHRQEIQKQSEFMLEGKGENKAKQWTAKNVKRHVEKLTDCMNLQHTYVVKTELIAPSTYDVEVRYDKDVRDVGGDLVLTMNLIGIVNH